MRTAEEILNSKFSGLSGNIITPIHTIQIKLIIAAMHEYAREAEDNYSHFWEDAHAKLEEKLRDEYEGKLRDEQLQNTHLAQKCSDLADENDTLKRVNESLEKSVKIWEISHSEQRKKIVKFLKHVESYPVQYTPGLRAEIENMINYFSK